jgi:hypothetical protein
MAQRYDFPHVYVRFRFTSSYWGGKNSLVTFNDAVKNAVVSSLHLNATCAEAWKGAHVTFAIKSKQQYRFFLKHASGFDEAGDELFCKKCLGELKGRTLKALAQDQRRKKP